MKFAIVQLATPQTQFLHVLHDPMRSLLFALEDLGHDVIVDKNQFHPDRINILINALCLHKDTISALIAGNIDYVIWQTEALSDQGINLCSGKTPEDLKGLGDKNTLRQYLIVLAHARMIWECFIFNQNWLQKTQIKADLLQFGYHPGLETRPKKENPDIDMLFFGSLTDYRSRILKDRYEKGELKICTTDPNLMRDEQLRRSKINLALRADDRYLTHNNSLRIHTALYANVMSVAENCEELEYMNDMCLLVAPENVFPTCEKLLKTGEWKDLTIEHKKAFQ